MKSDFISGSFKRKLLITCLLDIVLISQGEILSWSLMGVKGLGLLSTATRDMTTLAGHKEGFFVVFSLSYPDVVALSSFC